MASAPALQSITAEEFGKRPDPGRPEELVRGEVVGMPPPDRLHGYVCLVAASLLRAFVSERDLGRVLANDSGVITRRNPDTVRGADVCYYSYERLPRGPLSSGYGPEVPEIVVEVRSGDDRWREIHEKAAEYLQIGVLVVVVLDPKDRSAVVLTPDEPPRTLDADRELSFPGILEGFRVRVGKLFE